VLDCPAIVSFGNSYIGEKSVEEAIVLMIFKMSLAPRLELRKVKNEPAPCVPNNAFLLFRQGKPALKIDPSCLVLHILLLKQLLSVRDLLLN